MASAEGPGLERYENELRLFAYLMAGSLREAEMVAGNVLDSAASESVPLEKGAMGLLFSRVADTCIERLGGQPRRTLPSLAFPPSDPGQRPDRDSDDHAWLEPFPDDLFPDSLKEPDDAKAYYARECISLYMAAALQAIDPKARAAFILSDLFGWPPGRAEAVLELEERELLAALDGARETMAREYMRDRGRRVPPPDADATALVMRYLYPWETSDLDGLSARLAEDVLYQCPPSPSWYKGAEDFASFAREHLFAEGAHPGWRMLPLRANGQLGFGAYRLEASRRMYVAESIHVVYFDGPLVSEIVCFMEADLFPLFGLLPEVVVQGSI